MLGELNPLVAFGFVILVGNLIAVVGGRKVNRNLTMSVIVLGLALVVVGLAAELSTV